jgi:predicted alpha/beta-hydrolase family hydrolase
VASVFYLAGDSYPGDAHVETAVARRLSQAGVELISQAEILALAGGRLKGDVGQRTAQLERAIATRAVSEPPFVIGRSSGAIVATLASRRIPLAGVICLGYPFRRRGHLLEPARFAHLARLKTRTLIIQGDWDLYGGRTVTRDFALSRHIDLRFVPAGHRLELDAAWWDRVTAWILDFMRGAPAAPAWRREGFDETYYLKAHEDVAAQVSQGLFASGLDHYRRIGRHEGRSYRLPPRREPQIGLDAASDATLARGAPCRQDAAADLVQLD